MDNSKIHFIICGSDSIELEENKFYFERLTVPKGMTVIRTVVDNAMSMAQGYNQGMADSDAKYRIYLHQDTMTIKPSFLVEMLEIFRSDEKVGMLGVTGLSRMPTNAVCHDKWDLGCVFTNNGCKELNYNKHALELSQGENTHRCSDNLLFAQAVDGLFIATQYDMPWREDILGGFDFYDISQSMEFKKRGYKTAVPRLKSAWCWHDNETSRMIAYEKWRRIFIKEYHDLYPFTEAGGYEFNHMQESILSEFEQEVFALADAGDMEKVNDLLQKYQNLLNSKSGLIMMENICHIRNIEKKAGITDRFYGDGMTAQQMTDQLRKDKFLIKRVDFAAESLKESIFPKIKDGGISGPAVLTLAACYAFQREKFVL